jgi:hypothetical protein
LARIDNRVRVDCTTIGAEANLAARLQAIADPNSIVVSFETYALVRDIVHARPLPAISVKGISRQIVPYVVEGLAAGSEHAAPVFKEHAPGLDLFLDVNAIDDGSAERVRGVLCRRPEPGDRARSIRGAGGLGGGSSQQQPEQPWPGDIAFTSESGIWRGPCSTAGYSQNRKAQYSALWNQ